MNNSDFKEKQFLISDTTECYFKSFPTCDMNNENFISMFVEISKNNEN